MHIAILGAGFCGLATAWNLLQYDGIKVSLFDAKEIGKGTSGIAAGLLHPFVGAHSKLNWRAYEGLEATIKLVAIAQGFTNKTIILNQGLLRLAVSQQQKEDFFQCAALHPDVIWLSSEECQAKVPQILPVPGIWINKGYLINCEEYLKGLWHACKKKGASFNLKKIEILEELSRYDKVIIAAGALTNELPELAHLRLQKMKGQVLEVSCEDSLPSLDIPLNSQAYLLPQYDSRTYIAGATYERHFEHLNEEIRTASDEIVPKITLFFPGIKRAKILGCRAGVRGITPDRRPLIQALDGRKTWVITGMASKGLLYHALFAKELVHELMYHS